MKKLAIILSLILAALTLGCGFSNESKEPSIFDQPRTTYDLRYEVTGTAPSVEVNFSHDGGSTSDIRGVTLPWSFECTGDTLDYINVMARNEGETGTITTTIYRDCELWKTVTSEGAWCVASAEGLL